MRFPSRARLLAGAALLSLAGTGVASAASLPLLGGSLAAGVGTVTRCDDAVSATTAWSGTTTTSVTIADIASACAGTRLSIVLTNAGAPVASAGPVTVPTGGGQVVLPVSASAPVSDVEVSMVGS